MQASRDSLDLLGHDESRLASVGCHEVASFLEGVTRLAACLFAAQLGAGSHRLPRTGGYGTYLGLSTELAADLSQPEARALAQTLTSIASQPTGQAPEMTVQSTRNYISHGGGAPTSDEHVTRWRDWARQASDAILSYVEQVGGLREYQDRVSLGDVDLHPLIIQRDGHICWYQSVQGKGRLAYIAPVSTDDVIILDDHESIARMSPYLGLQKEPKRSELEGLYSALVKDIFGFTAPDTGVVDHKTDVHTMQVHWVAKSSAGDLERSDQFKVMPDNRWVWHNGSDWVGYGLFLADISNWQVTLRRLSARLSDIRRLETAATSEFSASVPMTIPSDVTTSFKASDEVGVAVAGPDPEGLKSFIDGAAEGVAGLPQVFFVTGEAGIGKTHALLTSTSERHDELSQIATMSDQIPPAYLYVNCGGTGLRSIKEIVDAAVVDTLNLNYNSVLTMCRNGLLILVIDGFDELVGGAGYSDAHELLRPTLQQLGDRGTIMVSARSSYLANQYKASIERAQLESVRSSVLTILEVERWNLQSIRRLFEANAHWVPYETDLSPADIELLGVPFFAKIFNRFAANPAAERQVSLNLRKILISGYLERERRKLDAAPTSGLTPESQQLEAVFSEIAGEMFETRSETIDRESFELACAAGLNVDLSERRYESLKDRLSVLCGISASQSDGAVSFAFEHDLFFQTFLAEYIQSRYLAHADSPTLLARLRQSMLGDTTVEALVNFDTQAVLDLIGSAGSLTPGGDEVLIQNLSSMAEHAIPVAITENLPALQNLSLRSLACAVGMHQRLYVTNCSIGHLELRASTTVSLTNSEISRITVNSNSDVSGVSIDERTRVDEVLDTSATNTRLLTSQADLWKALTDAGVTGAEDRLRKVSFTTTKTALEEFAEEALRRFAATARPVYVVEASRRVPGDGASRWMRDPNNPAWGDFTDALIATELAKERPLNSSGPAKLSVSFVVAPERILTRTISADVSAFWERLRR